MMETDLLESRHNDENAVLTLAETVLNGVRDEEATISAHDACLPVSNSAAQSADVTNCGTPSLRFTLS